MSTPTPETTERIKETARLRVEGWTWNAVAAKYRYSNGEVARRVLTGEHPALWRSEYESARAVYLDEIEAEAALTQRQLLRGDDKDLAQRAAHSLLAHCSKLRAQKIEHSGTMGLEHSGGTRVEGTVTHEHGIDSQLAEWLSAVAGGGGVPPAVHSGVAPQSALPSARPHGEAESLSGTA